MYLLDTNVISELRKSRPHGGVLSWLHSVGDSDLHISAVSLGEIQVGIEITREQDPEKAAEIELWAESLFQEFKVLPMLGPTFRKWARLTHPLSDSYDFEAMIAATALEHNLTVATRNTKDFAKFPVSVFDPFTTAKGRA
jgi:toxin FitB